MQTGLPIHLGLVGEQIVGILSNQPGQNAQIIHSELLKKKARMTYQNTHKTLQSLVRRGTLGKQNKKYFVSHGWMEKIKEFIDEYFEQFEENK